MGEIRRYSQKTSLSTESPNVLASPESYSASGRAIASIGEALGTVAEQLTKAQEFSQKTTAINQAKMQIGEITSRAAQDPDPNNIDKYAKEINDVHKSAGQGINLRNARDSFQLEFQSEANSGVMQLNKLKRAKIVDQGQASIFTGLKQFNSDFLNASSDDEPIILGRMEALIQEGYSHGFITAEEAVKMRDKNLQEIGIEKANDLINKATSTEEIEAIKSAVLSGEFEKNGVTIEPKAKESLLSNLDRKISAKERQQTYLEQQRRNELQNQMTELGMAGLLKSEQLEEAFLTRQISRTFYESQIDNVEGELGPTATTDPQTYYDLVHYLVDEGAEPEEGRKRLIEANTQGKLSREDMKKIYSMHLIPMGGDRNSLQNFLGTAQSDQDFIKSKEVLDAQGKKLKEGNGFFKTALDMFNSFFSNHPDKKEKVAGASQSLANELQKTPGEAKDIPAIARQVLGQEVLKRNPEIAKYPPTGVVKEDREGNKVRVFPDGTYEEIK